MKSPIESYRRFRRKQSPSSGLVTDLIVVTNEPTWFQSYDVRIIQDAIPGKGALGGLYTGLKYAQTNQSFCFGADMPFLNSRLIR